MDNTAAIAHRPAEGGFSLPQKVAVGIGLTNECDLSCAHCYRDLLKLNRLSLTEVSQLCDNLPIGSVNLGVGENGLHPQYQAVLKMLAERGIPSAVTSNGQSIEILTDEELRQLHSAEFSIDFPTEIEQDTWRAEGNWRKCIEGMARCREQGVAVAVIAVMMATNYTRLAELAAFAAQHDADFRFNVYQPVISDSFTLSYEQFWEGILDLVEKSDIVAISEPLVNALLQLTPGTVGSPCGRTSLRVLPNATVSPCTYWGTPAGKIKDLKELGTEIMHSAQFEAIRQLPPACNGCVFQTSCSGGCASRRKLRGNILEPDEFCPIIKGDEALLTRIQNLKVQTTPYRDMPKVGNACTFMVRGRTA